MSAEATEVSEQPQSAAAPPSAVENVTTVVAKFDRVAAGIGDLAAKFKGVLFEVATTKGMKEACAARLAIREPRYEVERVRKECKAPIIALGKDIDARAAKITEELLALEAPIDDQIKAEETRKLEEKKRKEEAERERVLLLQSRLAHIRGYLISYARQCAASIEEGIKSLVAMAIDSSFQEFEKPATELREQVLAELRGMHAAQLEHETEQQRLKLEREELARKTAEQEAANAKERERIAAEEAEARRKREAEDAERRRLQKIEDDKRAADEAFAKAKREADEAERQRKIDDGMAKMRAEREALQRQQAELDAQKAEIERQQAELAKPPPAPVAANAQLADDFVLAYDVVEIPAAGDVYVPAELSGIDAHVINAQAEQMLEEAQRVLGIPVIFTRHELAALAASPAALQVLIDYHDYQSVCADAADYAECCPFHDERSSELTTLRNLVAALRQKEIDG